MAESEEELKSLLRRMKEETEKAGFKLNIQKTKIMASSPITSWQTEGEKVEAVTDFILWGSKITVDSDRSHEIKRLFYTSVSLLLSRIQDYHYHLFKFHIYVLVYYIGVCLSGLIGSSFIHLIRTDSNVFFLMAE